jgi:3',5'-cyclic-AMP phosphodiesterase
MIDQTTFVHLSDTHIGPPGELQYGTDTAANLRAVARAVREMDLRPAAVVVSGDLSNHGEPSSYTHLKAILDEEVRPLGAPILLALGNHDDRASFRRHFLGEADADDAVHYRYVEEVGGLRFVVLDSLQAGRVHGLLGADQLAWLDEQLRRPGAEGRLVVLHHPSLPRGVPRPDDYLLEDRDAFGQVVARHEVLAVLCGHSHVPTAGLFAGTLHVAAPATAYLLDPSVRVGGRGYEATGFNVCTVRAGRLMVNTVVLPGMQRELYRHGTTFSAMPEREPDGVAERAAVESRG